MKNIGQNEYLNSIFNNDDNNTMVNVENYIKNNNINERQNLSNKDFDFLDIKTNNFINETNLILNENYGSFNNKNNIINDNNNCNNIPGIIGGNDNNYNTQLNAIQKIRKEKMSTINNENKYGDIIKEDKIINNLPESKTLDKTNYNSTVDIGVNNLEQNENKLENQTINNINIHDNSSNKNNKINNFEQNGINKENQNNNILNAHNNNNENQNEIPQFSQTINNEKKKEKKIFSPYIKLYRNYKKLFGDINIFNSILIMLINNNDVDNYLRNNNKRKNQVKFLENKFGCSLASILYHSYQYLYNNEKIYSKKIFNKYTEYIKLKYGQNGKCIFDINNTENILEFIYTQINFEFTFSRNSISSNNINNDYNANYNNFLYEFLRNNKSIISDKFTGFYQYNNSLNSQRNSFNSQNYNLKPFSFIKFNLNEINQFYESSNISEMNLNQFYNNINLYKCFDYAFKDKAHSIYSFPVFLTVVLSKADNCNFILNNELNLSSYTNNIKNKNGSYLLTSILCQMNYCKKLINYIFNQHEGSWFSLSDQEIKKVDSIDINAIPLILIYQLKDTIKPGYKEIRIKDKLFTNIISQRGLLQTKQLFFDQKDKIKDVRNKIKSWFDVKDSFTLLINGSIPKSKESLSKILEKGYTILVIPK